jgi:hypothetical protein
VTVSVAPDTDLPDRQVVQVDATGFAPGEQAFVGQCSSDPQIGFFSGGCGNATRSESADGQGEIHTTLRVHRDFSPFGTGGPSSVDCATSVGTCVIEATSVFDPLVTASAPLGFDPKAVAPGPTLTITPDGPWTNGQTVTVHGSGFSPGAELGLAECTATGDANAAHCARSLFDEFSADTDGEFTATTTLTQSFTAQSSTVDCTTVEGGCVLFAANRDDYGAERVAVALEWAGSIRLLAFTGADDRPLVLAGTVLLGLGVTCLAVARRRRRPA